MQLCTCNFVKIVGGDGVGGDGRPDSRPDNSDWRPGDRDRDRDRDPNRYPTDPNRYPPYDRYPSMRPGDGTFISFKLISTLPSTYTD